MEINYNVYGQPEQWVSTYYQQNDLTNKNKKAWFGGSSYQTQLRAGVEQNKLSYDTPIDKSLVYCGIGRESALSHRAYIGKDSENTGYLKIYEYQDSAVSNWAFFEKSAQYGSTNSPIDAGYIRLDDLGRTAWNNSINDDWNYSKYLEPYTFINPHNMVLLINVVVGTSLGNTQVKELSEYIANRANYPYLYAVYGNLYFGEYPERNLFAGKGTPPTGWKTTTLQCLDNYVCNEKNIDIPMYGISYGGSCILMGNPSRTDTMFTGDDFLNIFYTTEDGKEHIKLQRIDNSLSYAYLEYYDGLIEDILKTAACFGLYFTTKESVAINGALTHNDMYIGLIDDDGVGHGRYLQGADTVNAPQAAADYTDMHKIDYDPNKPPPPLPGKDPILPSGLYFTMAGRGTGIWAVTPGEIDQIWTDIFGSDVDVKMFGNNPMNAILSLKWTPFIWDIGSLHDGPVVLGTSVVNQLHTYPQIETVVDAEQHGWGTIQFTYDKNFYNARYMQARLFLPFYGYYELPTAQLLSSELRLDFYYNVPDELGVYVISYDDVIYDYVECKVDMDVPLTGSNAAALSANARNEALSIAAQVASTAASTLIGVSTVTGLTGAARHLAQGIDALADVGFGWGSAGIESETYLGMRGMGTGYSFTAGQALGIGAGLAGAGLNISNTIYNAKVERAALRTNLPYHGSALQTTFLHMSMKPYVQIFKNAVMEGLETKNTGSIKEELGGDAEAQYKLKVGHACDIWAQLEGMPENSLLQTTGMADMSSTGMEMAEAQELNSILQSGFYR